MDQYFGSTFEKDPDAYFTPNTEIYNARQRLKEWYQAFPKMKLATSNHGLRWLKAARKAGIPSTLMRTYREALEAPDGWIWRDRWDIRGDRQNFLMVHGMEYGGMYCYRQAPMIEGRSVVFGHLHAHAGISHIRTVDRSDWGMCVGCLIDASKFAFHYGKFFKWKPALGIGVILDGGRSPIWLPYE